MDDKMNLSEKDDPKKGAKGGAGKVFFRKKVCRFCGNGDKAVYKDPETLKRSVRNGERFCRAVLREPAINISECWLGKSKKPAFWPICLSQKNN